MAAGGVGKWSGLVSGSVTAPSQPSDLGEESEGLELQRGTYHVDKRLTQTRYSYVVRLRGECYFCLINSDCSIRAVNTRSIGRVLRLFYCVIFRIRWFSPSATYTLPSESTATPDGDLNRAAVPVPSADPVVPLPASVETTAVIV